MRFVLVEEEVIVHVVDGVDEVVNLPEGMTAHASDEGMVGDAWPLLPITRWVVIEAGVVINAIVARAELPGLTMVQSDDANIGDLYDGETFTTPPPPPPQVPIEITMRQARLVLLGAGLLDDVSTAIAALPSPQKDAAQIEWEYSNALRRDNAFVAMLAPALGLDDEAIDALFIAGGVL